MKLLIKPGVHRCSGFNSSIDYFCRLSLMYTPPNFLTTVSLDLHAMVANTTDAIGNLPPFLTPKQALASPPPSHSNNQPTSSKPMPKKEEAARLSATGHQQKVVATFNPKVNQSLKSWWTSLPLESTKKSLKLIVDATPNADYGNIWACLGSIPHKACLHFLVTNECTEHCSLVHLDIAMSDSMVSKLITMLQAGFNILAKSL